MPKRKRAEENDGAGAGNDAAPSDRALAKQRAQLPPKIEAGKKTLNRALKLSRAFERQKLSRRRKTAVQAGNDKDIGRIDAEIEALKKLNYHAVAEAHLYKTLLKIKLIASAPALPPWVRQPPKQTDAATMNITARLFNANPSKEAMAQVLAEIRGVLGLEEGGGGAKGGPQAKKSKAGKEDAKEREKKSASRAEEEEEEEEEEDDDVSMADGSEGEEDEEDGGAEIGNSDSEDEDEFAGFDDRIAGSDDDDSDDDDGRALAPKNYKPTRDMSITPDGTPSRSPTPSPSPPPPTKKQSAKQVAVAAKPTKSTFIPSLTLGGYVSDSDASGPEDDVDEHVAPVRRNRRGQRARQQLWEKKFGAGAKHVQKREREAGWDMRRGAVGEGQGRGGRGGRGGGRGGGGAARGGRGGGRGGPAGTDANAVAVGPARKKEHRDDAGKLHPSWEAAKKAKEKSAGAAAFQGKKVVFD